MKKPKRSWKRLWAFVLALAVVGSTLGQHAATVSAAEAGSGQTEDTQGVKDENNQADSGEGREEVQPGDVTEGGEEAQPGEEAEGGEETQPGDVTEGGEQVQPGAVTEGGEETQSGSGTEGEEPGEAGEEDPGEQPEEEPGEEAECICTEACVGGVVREDCPVCGAEGADLSACAGKKKFRKRMRRKMSCRGNRKKKQEQKIRSQKCS